MEGNLDLTSSTTRLFASASSTFEPLFSRLFWQVLTNLFVLAPLCLFESWFYQRDLRKEWGYFGVTSSASAEEKLANDVIKEAKALNGEVKHLESSSLLAEQSTTTTSSADGETKSKAWFRTKLAVCAFGLIGYHLLWGLFQERLVRTVYNSEGERFTSTTFLVFCSRFFGMIVSAGILKCFAHRPPSSAKVSSSNSSSSLLAMIPPLLVFSPPSVSNTMSSWCQLEALKHTSFPAQVIMKTFKMVPLIVIGTLMGKRYPAHEYIIAFCVACGVTFFVDGIQEAVPTEYASDEVAAALLKILYLVSDSFTAQWQETLFREYKLSTYQMMLGMNVCSCFLALFSLVLSQESAMAISFLYRHPLAIWHILGFAISGAIGQIFIFETIKEFGAMAFALITTTRQMIAVVLSIIVFGHHVSAIGWLGALAAFASLMVRFALVAKVKIFPLSWFPPIRNPFASTSGGNPTLALQQQGGAKLRKYRKLEMDQV